MSTAEIDAFRDRLCEAATGLFVEHGADGFTLRMLAARVGCSPMTPYRYFRDKDEILAAVRAKAFDRFSDALEAAARTPGDARAKSTATGEAYLAFAMANPAAYRLMFEMSPEDDARFPDLAQARARSRRCMINYVQAMIDDGVLKGEAVAIGQMFWAAIHGVVMLQFAGQLGEGRHAEALRRDMMRTLFIGLNAGPGQARPRPAPP